MVEDVFELFEYGLDLTFVPAGKKLFLGLPDLVLELDTIPFVASALAVVVLDGQVDGNGGRLLELEVGLDGLEVRGVDIVDHVDAFDELAHSFLIHGSLLLSHVYSRFRITFDGAIWNI